jgi:hypothetical protein
MKKGASGPSYKTGSRGGVYREVNGKRLYGRLKGRPEKAAPAPAPRPAAPSKGPQQAPMGSAKPPPLPKPTSSGPHRGTPAKTRPGGEKKKQSKDFIDQIGDFAKSVLPGSTPERLQLAGRVLSTVNQVVKQVAPDLEKKHPGALNAVKRWAVRKAVSAATSSVGKHVVKRAILGRAY